MTATGVRSGVFVEATSGFEPLNRGFADLLHDTMDPMTERKEAGSGGTKPNQSGVRSGVATLYRYYSFDGDLLYIGKTGMGQRRGSGHARGASWWEHAAFAEFFHSDAETVDLAEPIAIWQERPLYNRHMRVSTKARRAMLAVLSSFGPSRTFDRNEAAVLLRLTPKHVQCAVDLHFLESGGRRGGDLWIRSDEMARFIGTEDAPGRLGTAEADRDFRSRLAERLEWKP